MFADMQVILNNTLYSHRKEIHWESIDLDAMGTYVCKTRTIKNDVEETKSLKLEVVKTEPPVIDSRLKNGQVLKSPLGKPVELTCNFSGIPEPKLDWYKNGNKIKPKDDKHLTIDDNGHTIHLHFTNPEDEGKYMCKGTNRNGTAWLETTLKLTSNE